MQTCTYYNVERKTTCSQIGCATQYECFTRLKRYLTFVNGAVKFHPEWIVIVITKLFHVLGYILYFVYKLLITSYTLCLNIIHSCHSWRLSQHIGPTSHGVNHDDLFTRSADEYLSAHLAAELSHRYINMYKLPLI